LNKKTMVAVLQPETSLNLESVAISDTGNGIIDEPSKPLVGIIYPPPDIRSILLYI
jgi:hypothetical protein